MDLIGLIVLLILVCILVYVARIVIAHLGLPAPVPQLVYCLIAVIALVYIAHLFGVSIPGVGR